VLRDAPVHHQHLAEAPDHHVLRLEIPVDHAVSVREGDRLARRGDAEKLATLTEREREVLEHAARGLHAKEIAAALGISPRTVEVHKTRIMEKLGVRNVAELVRFALGARGDGGR
jgi:DNA-binding NarL/FixJ family response regulator